MKMQFSPAVLLLALPALLGCPPAPPAPPPGGNPAWDPDGDTISTAAELESHNRQRYGFDTARFDVNPSMASGTRSAGRLVGGINLPDTGTGYLHYRGTDAKDSDDWGTLALVNVIEQVGREFRRKPCQTLFPDADARPRAQPGDLSLEQGGVFPPHVEHQNGLDLDVRYVRDDREGPLNLADPVDRARYDRAATAELMACFLQTSRVIRILYDSVLTGIVNGPGENALLHVPGHQNHFHVRLADPDGGGN